MKTAKWCGSDYRCLHGDIVTRTTIGIVSMADRGSRVAEAEADPDHKWQTYG
jgi:hypothetical protein